MQQKHKLETYQGLVKNFFNENLNETSFTHLMETDFLTKYLVESAENSISKSIDLKLLEEHGHKPRSSQVLF